MFALCRDGVSASKLRPSLLEPHASHLASLGASLRFSAPYSASDGATLTSELEGSIIFVEGDNYKDLTALVTSDPYAECRVWSSIGFYEVEVVSPVHDDSLADFSDGERWYVALGYGAPLVGSALFRLKYYSSWTCIAEDGSPGFDGKHRDICQASLFASSSIESARRFVLTDASADKPEQPSVKAIPAAIGAWAKRRQG